MLAAACALVPLLVTATARAQTRSEILISELRFAGPSGVHDGFVDLYNPGSTGVAVTGWKLVYALNGSGTSTKTLGTATIAPKGHYLVADSSYSLALYNPADDTTSLSAAPIGVQLTGPDGTTVVDAVGEATAPSGFKSGTGLTAPSTNGQIAWARRFSAGVPVNTNNDASDFALVAVDANAVNYGTTAELGAPGPASSGAATQNNKFLQSTLLDTSVTAASAPNRVYDSGTQTLTERRVITNASASTTFGTARIRFTSITTYGTPGPASQAILVAQSSINQTVATSHGNVAVKSVTLDQPPNQSAGGGLNSSLTVPLPTGGLAPGASVAVNLQFHVARAGHFSFGYNVEATPAPTVSLGASSGHPQAGGSSATGLTVTGTNWTPGHFVVVEIGGGTVCSLDADASGNISGSASTCSVPQVPHGTQPITASDNGSPSITASGGNFTVTTTGASNPASASPGNTVSVSVAGFAASSNMSFKFDGTPITPNSPASPQTSINGSENSVQITIPNGTSAGTSHITATDASNNTTDITITINTPTVSITQTSGHPQAGSSSATDLNVSGGGWPSGDFIIVRIANGTACDLTADGSGNISASGSTCSVPQVPHGTQPITAVDNSNTSITATGGNFTVTTTGASNPASASPGNTVSVSVAGFAASSNMSFKFDGTPITPSSPATPKTGADGAEGGVQITIPNGTSAGTSHITATDASNNSVDIPITINTPTVSITQTSGHPQAGSSSATGLNVSGGGWPSGDFIVVQIGGQTVCALIADGSGNITGSASTCTVPLVPHGTQPITAVDNSNTSITATGGNFTVTTTGASNPASASPGNTVSVSVAGFAASSNMSFEFDGTPITPNSPASPQTSINGTENSVQITIPNGTSAGTSHITATDASNNTTDITITINTPTVSVSPTSGHPGDPLTVSGTGWIPGDLIIVKIGSGTVCDLTAAAGTGAISGNQSNGCTVPNVATGSQPLTGVDNSNTAVTATGSNFTVN